MRNLIEKITLDFETVTGEELIKILEYKKEMFPTLEQDIEKAIDILKPDCFFRLKRSRRYWNKTINERM